MRFLKLILFSILSFGILIFLISLLLPSTAVVERAGVIETTPDSVYQQINDLRTWPQWNPWTQQQAAQSLQFTGPATGAGAGYTWNGGQLSVLDSDPRKGLHYNMRYQGMRPVLGGLEIKPTADGKSTAIRWYMETKLGWLPWWKFRGFMADRLMGPQVEQGLTRLKERCERRP